MEISISIEELRKRSVFVGTPMYGGTCFGTYTTSAVELGALAAKYGIDVRFHFMFNESLIPRARNYIADEFMRSSCTHLLFIDADIGFKARDVLAMLAIAELGSEYDVVCGAYPKKVISWEKVKAAVEKGIANNDPDILDKFVGDYVFSPMNGTEEFRLDKPIEITEGGTGFMLIQKSALEKFRDAYPRYRYRPDHVRTDAFDGSREITLYFDAAIDDVGDSKRYLSEDYWFCQKARAIGLKVWLCPWIELDHSGTYTFGGSLKDLASIGG